MINKTAASAISTYYLTLGMCFHFMAFLCVTDLYDHTVVNCLRQLLVELLRFSFSFLWNQCKRDLRVRWADWHQVLTGTETRQLFSRIFVTLKNKELFNPTWNEITVSVSFVSSTLVVLNARKPNWLWRTQTKRRWETNKHGHSGAFPKVKR